MIIVKLNGGLGNQMFQYALGRKMSIKNKDVFKLDISDFEKNKPGVTPRTYILKHFNIIENFATPKEIRKIRYPYSIFSRMNTVFKKRILRTFNIGFSPKILEQKCDMYLDGFWQSEKYFYDIAGVLRQDFMLRNKMSHSAEIVYDTIKKTGVSISIHIRRGDYVQDPKTNNYHGVCAPEYYNKALDKITEKILEVDLQNTRLFIFSDDINWVKNNLSFPHPATFVSNPSIPDYEEMILMSKCSHHIIANSSFSWWGAWLNPKPNKIVIAPKKWLNNKPKTYKDTVPNSWTKI